MTLPKTFSAALVRRLNAACAKTRCERACGGIGWCQGCWDALGGAAEPVRESDPAASAASRNTGDT